MEKDDMEVGEVFVHGDICYEKIKEDGNISYFLVESNLNPRYELIYLSKVDTFEGVAKTTLLSPSPQVLQ